MYKRQILNRPSSYELDGWRVWFGGDVAEGGMFRGATEAKGEREILCVMKGNEFFGERSLLTDKPVAASAIAQTYTDMMLFDKQDVQLVLKEFPDITSQV